MGSGEEDWQCSGRGSVVLAENKASEQRLYGGEGVSLHIFGVGAAGRGRK